MKSFLKAIYMALLMAVIILAFSIILPAYVQLKKMRGRIDELKSLLAEKEAKCLEMDRRLKDIEANDPKTIEKIAREKYGMCKPGEVIYRYEAAPFKLNTKGSWKDK